MDKFKIFDIRNPNGSINSGEKQYLYCLFRPLEEKTYKFEVKIKVFDIYRLIQDLVITLEGKGFTNRPNQALTKEIEDIPRQRSLVSNFGSKVFFSIEEIDFGELEPEQCEHRIIILYNLSNVNRLNFKFKTTGLIWLEINFFK